MMLCRMMQVSQSGYYQWRKRLTKAPSRRHQGLASLMRNCYLENRRRYGRRRIRAALQKTGVKVGRFVIRRLMRDQNLKAIEPKSFKPKTTDSKGTKGSPNLLAQITVKECAIRKIIVGDIAYVPLLHGKWCYLAFWQDKVQAHHRLEFVRSNDGEAGCFSLAKGARETIDPSRSNCSFRSGSQYAATEFRELLRINSFRQSMSGKGNCYDNAQAEIFFSRFKTELLEGGVFEDLSQARSKYLVILKVTATEKDCIPVWDTSAHLNLS